MKLQYYIIEDLDGVSMGPFENKYSANNYLNKLKNSENLFSGLGIFEVTNDYEKIKNYEKITRP